MSKKKKVSRFEYALYSAIAPDLIKDCVPMTEQEEQQKRINALKEQLNSFVCSTTNRKLFTNDQAENIATSFVKK